MRTTEAEKLLGGHATGTLTADERRALFTAALGHQAIFDALMDEEILRELLADSEAKAQLIAALAAPAMPKVVPFWRRTGVLGAAASLIVAATAGLAYLRSPNALPTVPRPEARQEPAAKAAEAPAAKAVEGPAMKGTEAPGAGKAPVLLQRKAAPAAPPKSADQPRQEAPAPAPPAPVVKLLAVPSAGAVAAQEDSARQKEKMDYRRAEAQDQVAKRAEAPRSAAAVVEVVSAQRSEAPERKRVAQDKAAAGLTSGVVGGVVGGVAPSPAPVKAKLASGLTANAAAPAAPAWTLEAQPDGRTRVTVSAPRSRTVVLLRRGAAGVEALPLQLLDDRGQALLQWRAELRLATGDALDLYLLNAPVAEPARLPETGPVDGFRARIYPAAK